MLCIDSHNNNPYYNLAAEEYFLKNTSGEYFMIWESKPSVIVGKHQNTLSEINYRFNKENGILIARRLTGGGTVFHDAGNINFTFIRNGQPGQLVNFSAFVDPVLKFLRTLGIEATKGDRHEILVNGRKISGNAEHVYKNRVLHHGTLLFHSDLGILNKSIDHRGGKFYDKAVQSNRAGVINLSQCLNNLNVNRFRESFFSYIKDSLRGSDYIPDDFTNSRVVELAGEKYSTWDWIYGWSPDYQFTNEFEHGLFQMKIDFGVHRGIITNSNLTGCSATLNEVNKILIGRRHSEPEIREALRSAGLNENVEEKAFEELVFAFF
ncbi:MAG TPA: lipoate--protein ligase [Bacteroidales bacterium]|jgi:lipoate-protein ligase A|nr:lipoate--protein ligase [Bacteroidales bacterium]